MKLIWHFLSSRRWDFFWSQGCFCRASSLAGLSRSPPAWAAEGILSMLMREMDFEICLQFTLSFLLRSDCFVCLFLILVAGNSYGQTDYRILGYISVRSSLYLSHILWLHRRCILDLSFQNSLSARQWSHHFNILDVYFFAKLHSCPTSFLKMVGGHGCFRNALPEIPKEKSCNFE